MLGERPIHRKHRFSIAFGTDDHRADLRFVQPQPQKRIVELAKRAQRPPLVASGQNLGGRRRLLSRGRLHGEIRRTSPAIEGHRHGRIADGPVGDGRVERSQHDPRSARGTIGHGGEFARASSHRFLEPAGGPHRVHEPPLDRALPFDAFHERAEEVRAVASHATFVDDAGETASAWEHAEQRRFGQADRRVAIVHQENLIARERELVPAARARAVDRREELEARMPARVLDRESRLVGELAEVHLPGVRRRAQHHDVRAGAEDPLLQAVDHDRAHAGMFEADALQCVGELDVDAEVVRIQFEPVVRRQTGVFADIHRQCGDRAVERELPVPIPIGMGVEGDRAGSVGHS